jgi:hypothetical protein
MTDKKSSNRQVFKSECMRIGPSPIDRKSSKIIIVTSTERKPARENTLQKETWRKNQHKTKECTAFTFCDLKHWKTIPHQIYNQRVSYEIPNTTNTIVMPVSVEILKQSAHMGNQTNTTQISKKWVNSWNSVWIKHVEDTNRLTPNKQGIQRRRGCAQRVHANDHYRRKIMYTWKEVNQQESLLLYKEDLIQVWLPKRQNLLI